MWYIIRLPNFKKNSFGKSGILKYWFQEVIDQIEVSYARNIIVLWALLLHSSYVLLFITFASILRKSMPCKEKSTKLKNPHSIHFLLPTF